MVVWTWGVAAWYMFTLVSILCLACLLVYFLFVLFAGCVWTFRFVLRIVLGWICFWFGFDCWFTF